MSHYDWTRSASEQEEDADCCRDENARSVVVIVKCETFAVICINAAMTCLQYNFVLTSTVISSSIEDSDFFVIQKHKGKSIKENENFFFLSIIYWTNWDELSVSLLLFPSHRQNSY